MQLVSVIIPCYNEQVRISGLLAAIKTQTYPRDRMEVVIADGGSTDQTRAEIDGFMQSSPDLRILLVENRQRNIPTGLNLAIRASKGDIIVRMDAHSLPYPDYIERCVEALTDELGENVGGIWEIQPGNQTWIAHSISRAASLPIAVGDAMYRHATKPAYVETVPFGAFKRELLAINGFFDETLLTNEDYEFNSRIAESGGRIWLDPKIRSKYFARSTLSELARQYARYGYWKWKMLQRYPKTLRWRQALPPIFIFSLVMTSCLAILSRPFWLIPVGEISMYFLLLITSSINPFLRERKPFFLIGIPLAIATMHFSWGLGLIWSMISNTQSGYKQVR
jgi:succinoglycan biosynthesis protein ExoA